MGVLFGFGVCTIFAHPCESTASISNDNNFLVRTTICAFLDSMKISLRLEFNHIPVNGILCSQFWVFLALFKELCGLLWALFIPQLVKNTKLSLHI